MAAVIVMSSSPSSEEDTRIDEEEFCLEGARDDAGDTVRGTAMVFSWSMEEANARHLSSVVLLALEVVDDEAEEEEDTQDVSDRGVFLPMARGPRTTAMLVDDW